jgi:7-keto-8-aminopelargonate synthetase-like enzyme
LNYVNHSTSLGIFQLQSGFDTYNGRNLGIKGKNVIHFANCSYVGLDVCEALKLAAIEAVTRYGTLFSTSRLCVGLDLNEKLEALLNQMTGNHTLVTQSTTLGSISAIPIIVSPNDLIVLDHQVHTSVQNAVKLAESQGTKVGMIRHNNISSLEDVIQKNQNKYGKIWYMADGIYSMLGDACPIEELYELMDRYSNFHCYVDDAHGISWIGEHGKGMIKDLYIHKWCWPYLWLKVSAVVAGYWCSQLQKPGT